jgi:hypothetical protein
MSKIKNYMMDIEDFCNGYFQSHYETDFTVDEVVEDVGIYFKTDSAKDYARNYLTKTLGEM